MFIQRKADIPSSEITPESTWLNRRQLMQGTAAVGAGLILPPSMAHAAPSYQRIANFVCIPTTCPQDSMAAHYW